MTPHPVTGVPVASARRVGRAAAGSFAARVAGAVLMLAFQVLVARRLGLVDAGRFYLVFVVVSVLAVVGRYGTDQLILRSVAVGGCGPTTGIDRAYRGCIALAATLLSALALAQVASADALADVVFADPHLAGPLRLGALGLVPFGLVAVQGEALKGLGRTTLGASVQSMVGPVVSLALLVLLPAASTPSEVVVVYVAGLAASSIVGHAAWRVLRPPPVRSVRDPLALARLRRSCTPFFWTSLSGLALAWASVLALGASGRGDEVATYFAAERWTAVASMALVAVNGAVGPSFARLWVAGDAVAARRLLRSTTAALAAGAAVLFTATVVLAEPLLGLFGEDFPHAADSLRILAVGQLVVLAGGPVTALLVMIGGEREQARAGAVSAVVLALLLVVLVPRYGAPGAAVATAVSLVLNKAIIVSAVRTALAGIARPPVADPEEEVDRGDVPGGVVAGRHGAR